MSDLPRPPVPQGPPVPPDNHELKAEVRRTLSRDDAIASVLNNALKFGVLGWMGWCCVLIARALAGQTTVAIMQVLANIHVSEALAYIFGVGGIAYGRARLRDRDQAIRRMSARIAELERGFDPKRSSSGLGPGGHTPPEDPI